MIKIESCNIAISKNHRPLASQMHILEHSSVISDDNSAFSVYGGQKRKVNNDTLKFHSLHRDSTNFKLRTRLMNKEKSIERGFNTSVTSQVEQGKRLAQLVDE